MKVLRFALEVLKNARRPYLVLNIAYYGLVACGMLYVTFDRSLQQALLGDVLSGLTEGPFASVLDAYLGEQALLAIGLTFGVNLVLGSFLWIALPSCVVPFSGLLLAGLRAVLWGFLFSPQIVGQAGARPAVAYVLIVVLILLEGQGYVLAALGAYLQGRAFLWPRRVGATGRLQGYVRGLKQEAHVYLLVAAVLLVAAAYEVWTAIVALPALR
jgi:hypothetical protein